MAFERAKDWKRPHEVVLEIDESDPDCHKQELRAVGLLMIGLECTEGVFLDPHSEREGVPDVEIIDCQRYEVLERKRMRYVEVVTKNEHTGGECLSDFLERTKLNGVYDYPDRTAILCNVKRHLDYVDWQGLSREVCDVVESDDRHSWTVFALENRVDGASFEHRVVELHPETRSNTFNTIMPVFRAKKKYD